VTLGDAVVEVGLKRPAGYAGDLYGIGHEVVGAWLLHIYRQASALLLEE
jgi:hypothetical protein